MSSWACDYIDRLYESEKVRERERRERLLKTLQSGLVSAKRDLILYASLAVLLTAATVAAVLTNKDAGAILFFTPAVICCCVTWREYETLRLSKRAIAKLMKERLND